MQEVLRASGGAAVGSLVRLYSVSVIHLVLSVLRGRRRRRRRPGGQVAALLLGDVGFWAVDGLDVLPEGAGIRVALGAARDLTYIRFLWTHEHGGDGVTSLVTTDVGDERGGSEGVWRTSLECVRF